MKQYLGWVVTYSLPDNFLRGIAAGAFAGIVTAAWNIPSFYFGLSTMRFLDFGAVLIYGHRPINAWESIFAQVGVFFFMAMLGVLFAHLSPKIKSDHQLLKGWFFSIAVWFGSYAITILFDVPEFRLLPLKTAFSNFIGASIWGVTLVYALKWMDKRKYFTRN